MIAVWAFRPKAGVSVECGRSRSRRKRPFLAPGLPPSGASPHTPEILHSGPAFDRDHRDSRSKPNQLDRFRRTAVMAGQGKIGARLAPMPDAMLPAGCGARTVNRSIGPVTISAPGATLMIFSHPLARSASVFTAKNNDGSEYRVLAIVTTLELDPKSQNYKKPFVEKLSRAAKDYLADSDEAAAFVLMNRPNSSSGGGARRRPGDARKMVEGHSGSF